jgi:hypothetical protein
MVPENPLHPVPENLRLSEAISIAYRALQNGFDALFTTAAELIDHLSATTREGKMREALAVYLRLHVLVVDEVGYLAYGDDAANVLYRFVNDRQISTPLDDLHHQQTPKALGAQHFTTQTSPKPSLIESSSEDDSFASTGLRRAFSPNQAPTGRRSRR